MRPYGQHALGGWENLMESLVERWSGLSARVRRAWFGVGPVATAKAVVWRVGKLNPEVHRNPDEGSRGPSPFDVAYAVETGGFLGWRALQSGEANDAYISGYFGTTPSIGRRLIGGVDRPEEYTFVDVGCGKGRVVIMASERGFGRVVGVEIAGALAKVARANAVVVARRFPERTVIEIVHEDAVRFEWPPGPLVLFLYQPFERPVMRALLERVAATLAAAPRPVVLIYLHPELAKMVDQVTAFERRAEGVLAPTTDERPFSYGGRGDADGYIIWGTRMPAPSLTPI